MRTTEDAPVAKRKGSAPMSLNSRITKFASKKGITNRAVSSRKDLSRSDPLYDSFLDSIEKDLRNNVDRSSELTKLSELMGSESDEIRIKASWCIAKMGQNKIPKKEIIDILNRYRSDDVAEVRENVAWGIGEIVCIGICDEKSISTLIHLMHDRDQNVRGMAVWAVGRVIDKTSTITDEMVTTLRSLENDESQYVKECVSFAKEKITSSWRS